MPRRKREKVSFLLQCCESGMSYSVPGYVILEFRTHAYLEIIYIKKTHLVINQKEASTNYSLCCISKYYKYTNIVLQSGIHRPKIRNKILIYLLFHSCRIRNTQFRIEKKFPFHHTC